MLLSHVLWDLDVSIKLMSYSIDKRLDLGEVKLTTVKLLMADRSYIFPRTENENVLVS